jgi:hypothetical protein
MFGKSLGIVSKFLDIFQELVAASHTLEPTINPHP